MGQIYGRPTTDGRMRYTAQVRRRKGGEETFSLAETFDTEKQAEAWIKKVERELKAGRLQRTNDRATVKDLIALYMKATRKTVGKTKTQCLEAIAASDFGRRRCMDLTSTNLVDWMREMAFDAEGNERAPQTVGNYVAHLAAVWNLAPAAFDLDLDPTVMRTAKTAAKDLGLIAKSAKRTRRPKRGEMDRLMAFFQDRTQRTDASPMHRIVPFAMASSRRLGEITRMLWDDLDAEASTILIRQMKHPGEKESNDVEVDLPPRALAIILSMPRTHPEIFPFNPETIGTRFTRACTVLGIADLHFHDLRHEAVSCQLELGKHPDEVCRVSGHTNWMSLQRYAHVKKKGDAWADWDGWTTAASPGEAERQTRRDPRPSRPKTEGPGGRSKAGMTLVRRREAPPTCPKRPGERRGTRSAPAGGTIEADPDRAVVDVRKRARSTGASRAHGRGDRAARPGALEAGADAGRHVQDAGGGRDEVLSLDLIRTLLAA